MTIPSKTKYFLNILVGKVFDILITSTSKTSIYLMVSFFPFIIFGYNSIVCQYV